MKPVSYSILGFDIMFFLPTLQSYNFVAQSQDEGMLHTYGTATAVQVNLFSSTAAGGAQCMTRVSLRLCSFRPVELFVCRQTSLAICDIGD